MTYLLLSTIGFITNWICLRKRRLEYAIVASFIYLFAFVYIQSFDILFIIYLFFIFVIHIKDFRKRHAMYFAAEFGLGLLNGNYRSIIATFLTRYFPLIFAALIDKKKSILSKWDDEYEQRILRLIVLCEVIISALLIIKGGNEEIFVVSHQPVGANLSLVGSFIAMDISLKPGNQKLAHKIENIVYLGLFSLLALISGIRGYIIIIIPCAFYSFISYVFGESKRAFGLILAIAMSVWIIMISFLADGRLANMLISLDTSTGYRKIENRYILEALSNANPIRWIVGYGIGATGRRIGSDALIGFYAGQSVFYTHHLTYGSVLLNFWLSVFKDMGLVGLVIMAKMFFGLIPKRTIGNRSRRVGWILYLVLYAFMLLFRTSCTNSLIELYTCSLIMNNPVFAGANYKLENGEA